MEIGASISVRRGVESKAVERSGMRIVRILVVLLVVGIAGAGIERAQTPSDQPVVRLDPVLDSLISPDAKLGVVKSGFGFTEGINWVQRGENGYLLFSDVAANVVNKMTPDGRVSVYVNESGYRGPWNGYTMATVGVPQNNGKNPKDPLFREFIMIGADGLTLDLQGRLIMCTFSGRSLDRVEKNGKRTVLADRYDGKRFGGTNDVVVKKDGAIYFTDTTHGMRGKDNDPSKELDPGIYMLKDGKVTLVVTDIPDTNGLAFSPDEKYLYANGSALKFIRRYDVQPDDTLTNSQLLIDMSGDKSPGITDGMRVDSKGNIYESGPRGIWIVSPEGKHLGTILTPEKVANLTFGDPDYKTLYIAAQTSIYKIRVNTPGQPCNSCSSK
jgi:gluconolactonase